MKACKVADGHGRLISIFLTALTAAAFALSCKEDSADREGKKSAAYAAASVGVGVSAASASTQAGAFDGCLVGTWKTTRLSLQSQRVAAEGGANIALEVKPTGEATLDFDKMAPIAATATPTTFEFQYSGKSTGKFTTPAPGALKVASAEYTRLHVTAKVSIPGAGSVELFKNTPIAELEKIGKAAADDDGLPLPEPSGPPTETIDPQPVFSSTSYSCVGDKLQLKGTAQGAVWDFDRVP